MSDVPTFSLPIRCVAVSRSLLVCAVLGSAVGGVRAGDDRPVSFVNDVMPVLTRAGCNAGVCHAKAGGGQNGFQLSLLGFEAAEDFEHIVSEGRGRRLFPAAPEESLLLRKASGVVPHGGGIRLVRGSEHYETVRSWIHQGARWDGESAPRLKGLKLVPERAVLTSGSTQSLTVIACYDDTTERDVTSLALFESNDPAMAEVSGAGIVTARDLPGRVAVMVRYQGLVGVFNAAIPLGAPVGELPPSNGHIDDLVFANLTELGIPPSAVCDDATFLRRVSLDVAGRLPTIDESRAFLASQDADKRRQAVDRLLQSPDYADYFASKWTALLKNRRDDASDITSNFAFYSWVRDSLLANKPYDQLVRELLAATGTVISNPPVAWYKRVREPKQQQEDVAQLFLGVRMQCAQCHHHPFERWSQEDYYGLTAFFTQVGRKPSGTRGEDLIFHKRGVAAATSLRTGVAVKPAALGDTISEIPPDVDPRLRLADWMASPDNPYFAKAVVNRYWKHFLRRGLIEPEDDIRDSNPPSNAELLRELERGFIASGFDLKALVRTIVSSTTYQLSSIPGEHNRVDEQNYSRYYPRRLSAEVLLDAIDDLTGNRTDFANLPAGTRAIALPDNSYNASSPFLRVFGRPENESVCECERVQSSSLAQSLHLMNAGDIKAKLSSGSGRATTLAAAAATPEDKVRELYLVAFCREPRPDELATAVAFLSEPVVDANGNPVDPGQATRDSLQDLIWALINTKEFLFNH